MKKTKKIILSAILLAVLIVLSRFLAIKTPIIKISFGFIPIMLSAIWLGPKWTCLISVLGDMIGAILFPFGAYFPGYTFSSFLTGLIYGLLLYQKQENTFTNKQFIIRLIISSFIVLILVNGVLNTVWTYITAKSATSVIVPVRIAKQLIMLPIQIIAIYFLEKVLRKSMNQFIRSNDETKNK